MQNADYSMPSCLQGGELGEQKKSKNPRKKREERGKKKKRVVRFVSLCRVELDGRACTHCGKHPMVVAYLFARTISLDNVVRWGCNDLFLDHLQQL